MNAPEADAKQKQKRARRERMMDDVREKEVRTRKNG